MTDTKTNTAPHDFGFRGVIVSKPRQLATATDAYDTCDECDFFPFGSNDSAPVAPAAKPLTLSEQHRELTIALRASRGRSQA